MDIYRRLIKSALAKASQTTFHLFSFFEHYRCSLAPCCLLPKRCTHHLTHNNNSLFSHRRNLWSSKVFIYMPAEDKHTLMCPQLMSPGRSGLRDITPTCLTHVHCVTHTCTHTDTCRPFSSLVVLYRFPVWCGVCFWLSRLRGVVWSGRAVRRRNGRRYCFTTDCLLLKMSREISESKV